MKKIISPILLILLLTGCKQKNTLTVEEKTEDDRDVAQTTAFNFDLQGHRGARGLAPENTLPAFKKALELGVNTLELDVSVTKDKKLLVSHEPWFNREICLDSTGNRIAEKDSIRLNIYQHTYKETQKYDCGSLGNERFPEQQKQNATKPLLTAVIEMAEKFSAVNNTSINYNIEIKSLPAGDNIYHPAPEEFSDLLINVLKEKLPKERIVIQSFDFRVLKYIHENYPEYTLAALVYKDNVNTNLSALGFIPEIYSPAYALLNTDVVAQIHDKNMKVIPWTVNDTITMRKLLEMGVDGLITDYPNKALVFKD